MMRQTWFQTVLVGIVLAWAPACGTDDTGSGGEPEIIEGEPVPDAVIPDAAIDWSTPSETVLPDNPNPGEFGASCQGNEDCLDGWCIEGPDGFVCSRECVEECPPGWDCRGVRASADVAFICLPRFDRLCAPCVDESQCNGGRCLLIDGEQRCARECEGPEDCPDRFVCQQEGDAGHCVPDTGSCSCFSEFDGGLRTCLRSNSEGTCYGVEACDTTLGWGECSARNPEPEQCNGIDDNCNAFIDEDIAEVGQPCQVTVAGVGSCDGVTVCAGANGLQCQGRTPQVETCNFEDDNCDGVIDGPFKTNGVYADFEHCGTCNRSCAFGFPNASQTRCAVQQGVAQCVVVSCEPGYIKQNDFQCVPDIVNLCEACSDNSNCLGQDSACVQLSDGRFCAKACDGAADCPAGFSCQNVSGESRRQCIPTTGVCSCSSATIGLSRTCTRTVSPGGQPSYTCAGSETCGASGWGSCVMPAETCNGVDDNCDGRIDEGFRNAQGRYDRVEHCGACNVSCLALNFANATPTCDASGSGVPRCSYTCNAGWFDVDDQPGCECQFTSSTDHPDPQGLDSNCDGIDGEVARSVFVAKTGDDSNNGTLGAPMRTIQAGIDRAVLLGRRDVLVATGVYVESIELKNAVNVYGGYSNDFRQRDTFAFETAILGVDSTGALPGAVNAISVATTSANAITFDGFSVFGADNPVAGHNSYAVYLRNVGSHLRIRHNYIVAGNGGNGDAGTKGADGSRGDDGSAGVGAASVGSSCSSSNHAAGGAGGTTSCGGSSTAGGAGGTRVCPDFPSNFEDVRTSTQTIAPERNGVTGANNAAGTGAGGAAGWHQRIQNDGCNTVSASWSNDSFGAAGEVGRAGSAGGAGSRCMQSNGTVGSNGHWVGNAPGEATPGAHGGGGGGGGSGGGIGRRSGCTTALVVGGSGGGGGAGGCRGGVGEAGTSGGGSFGIFLAYASAPSAMPTIQNNTVLRGRGGAGGAGGAGGVGGAGGFGGLGGPSNRGTGSFPLSCCSSAGGAGGNGGAGGHGPGGGGGCGGPAFGIYIAPVALSVSRPNISGNTLPSSGGGGQGGPGGTSLGNVGLQGNSGLNTATNF